MRIQSNLLAMNTNRNIKINTRKSTKIMEKLASGYRINRAADDAAGLSISEKMRALIRGLTQASRNCQDGISMIQTAEGALHEVHAMLQRMNELAVQSANDTNVVEDREALQQEFTQIQEEIDRLSQTTTFNTMRLFADDDGSASTTNVGGANNSNTPSVTNLDGTGQQIPVTRMMSMARSGAIDNTGGNITVGEFTLTGTGLVKGTDYSYSNNTLTILSDKAITISGTTSKDHITIKSGIEANVTLSGVNIDLSSQWFISPILVDGTAKLNLTLVGENTLVGGGQRAGIQVEDNATLVVDGEGKLTATGTQQAAGIGGGLKGTGGTIIINGGTITAKGGMMSAGIGSAADATSTGDIMINGGTVVAIGNHQAAGIGGAAGLSGGNINISGGNVTAIGGGFGAGIGGGNRGSGGNITISGGYVTAKGENGIGKGSGGSGGTFTTTNSGNAIITTEGAITDQSDKANWSGWINEQTYGNPILSGNGTIDLSTITGDLIILDTGYKIGNKEYAYTGSYTFSGSTTQEIVVENDADFTFNNVTGTKFTVKDNSTVDVTLNGTSEMNEVIVESGSTLNTSGTGTLKVKTKLDNDGMVNIGSGSTLENDGTIENSNIINNNGTLDNDGTLKNDGTVNNNSGGTVNNNTGSTIDNTNGTIINSSGTINDNGTITGNQPTTGGGSGTGGGTEKNSWWIQAGAGSEQGLNLHIGAMNTKVLSIEKDTVNILTHESSSNAITAVNDAIEKVSEQRTRLGAYQNRLEHTIRNIDNTAENTASAESRIRDTDMAEAILDHSKNNILMQAAQAMLAQANQQPQGILQLLN